MTLGCRCLGGKAHAVRQATHTRKAKLRKEQSDRKMKETKNSCIGIEKYCHQQSMGELHIILFSTLLEYRDKFEMILLHPINH